jgi:hypothetical protein
MDKGGKKPVLDTLYVEELNLQEVDSAKGFQEFLYAADFENGIRQNLELQSRLDAMRCHYEESVSQWNSERRAMHEEIDRLRAQRPGPDVLEEIARANESIQGKELELEGLMLQDPFPFATILQMKAECQNLKAYIKGLSFNLSRQS